MILVVISIMVLEVIIIVMMTILALMVIYNGCNKYNGFALGDSHRLTIVITL